MPVTVTIDWGDGSVPTVETLPASSTAFAVPHAYAAAKTYLIHATLADATGANSVAQALVEVRGASAASAPAAPPPLTESALAVAPSSSVVEGQTITITGALTPADAAVTKVVLDWDDGSKTTTLSIPAGASSFTAPHAFLWSSAGVPSGQFVVDAFLFGPHGLVGEETAGVTVAEVAPIVNASSLVTSETVGNAVTVTGSLGGYTGATSVEINWGDGSSATSVNVTPGATTYTATHYFPENKAGELKNPADVTVGLYTINAQVLDGTTSLGRQAANVTVSNTATEASGSDVVLSPIPTGGTAVATSIHGGDTVTLTGSFTDPGTLEPYTVTIHWGDGASTMLSSADHQIFTSDGQFVYLATHQYLDNGSGSSEVTQAVLDAISVSVSDGTSTTTVGRSVSVQDAAPSVRIESVVKGSSAVTVELTAAVSDLGSPGSETVRWSPLPVGGLWSSGGRSRSRRSMPPGDW